MSAPRILVVEDEPAIADTITYALSTDGFEPHWCASGAAALQAQADGEIALAILDIGLPDINGFELFKRLTAQQPGLPVIFLTARTSEIDRVVGLELGADDYVAKPFSPRELVARVRTVLRRTQRAAAATTAAPTAAPVPAAASAATHGFAIDDERKQIRFRGKPLDLSRIEYRLLKVLAERPGRVYSRDELMQRAWDDPAAAFDRTVDAHVKMLRAKLREIDAAADPIVTHRGLGYSLREE
jgi:two-component system, OmpR family, catabolic regulation response regulator CreB